MIRQLLLVNCNKWPANPPKMPDVELGVEMDISPVAWPAESGMSHRGYLLTLNDQQMADLRKTRLPMCVTRHGAGTDKNPTEVEAILASIGLELGSGDNA